MEETEKDKELKKYKLTVEFFQEVLPAQNQNKLIQQATNFIVRKFKLNNALLTTKNTSYRYYSSKTDKTYKQIEDILRKQMQNTKTPITAKIKTDFMLKEIKEKEHLPDKATAYPLLAEKEITGYLFLYTEREPQNAEFIPEIIKELTKLIKQVTDYEKIKETSIIDPLTELYNRHYLTQNFETLLNKLKKEKKPISVMMFDIDDFKKYNDTYGHPEGDKILQKIAKTTKQTIKKGTAYRYGGEEFLIIMPTDSSTSKETAEQLRKKIKEENPLTISIGLATSLHSNIQGNKLIKEADKALYQAKKQGKNKTVQYIIVNENLIIDTEKI
ncbi:hypothetical protein DRJ22_01370 [Candidatus Woesearchaeota archaeon]|nr:MAG: hypothetical protein B6U93_00720 [Candidatus Woesearchaeota archaeon ex4484_78]RLE46652.1 MAG: hypothetical protein DRJ22_01370 [Candidatus Woesearchaeota archaeon]